MKNKVVYVIHELDLESRETDVIGVCSSLDSVNKLIDEYYGDSLKQISYTDIRDSTLEWSKVFEVESFDRSVYKVQITVQWFMIDEL